MASYLKAIGNLFTGDQRGRTMAPEASWPAIPKAATVSLVHIALFDLHKDRTVLLAGSSPAHGAWGHESRLYHVLDLAEAQPVAGGHAALAYISRPLLVRPGENIEYKYGVLKGSNIRLEGDGFHDNRVVRVPAYPTTGTWYCVDFVVKRKDSFVRKNLSVLTLCTALARSGSALQGLPWLDIMARNIASFHASACLRSLEVTQLLEPCCAPPELVWWCCARAARDGERMPGNKLRQLTPLLTALPHPTQHPTLALGCLHAWKAVFGEHSDASLDAWKLCCSMAVSSLRENADAEAAATVLNTAPIPRTATTRFPEVRWHEELLGPGRQLLEQAWAILQLRACARFDDLVHVLQGAVDAWGGQECARLGAWGLAWGGVKPLVADLTLEQLQQWLLLSAIAEPTRGVFETATALLYSLQHSGLSAAALLREYQDLWSLLCQHPDQSDACLSVEAAVQALAVRETWQNPFALLRLVHEAHDLELCVELATVITAQATSTAHSRLAVSGAPVHRLHVFLGELASLSPTSEPATSAITAWALQHLRAALQLPALVLAEPDLVARRGPVFDLVISCSASLPTLDILKAINQLQARDPGASGPAQEALFRQLVLPHADELLLGPPMSGPARRDGTEVLQGLGLISAACQQVDALVLLHPMAGRLHIPLPERHVQLRRELGQLSARILDSDLVLSTVREIRSSPFVACCTEALAGLHPRLAVAAARLDDALRCAELVAIPSHIAGTLPLLAGNAVGAQAAQLRHEMAGMLAEWWQERGADASRLRYRDVHRLQLRELPCPASLADMFPSMERLHSFEQALAHLEPSPFFCAVAQAALAAEPAGMADAGASTTDMEDDDQAGDETPGAAAAAADDEPAEAGAAMLGPHPHPGPGAAPAQASLSSACRACLTAMQACAAYVEPEQLAALQLRQLERDWQGVALSQVRHELQRLTYPPVRAFVAGPTAHVAQCAEQVTEALQILRIQETVGWVTAILSRLKVRDRHTTTLVQDAQALLHETTTMAALQHSLGAGHSALRRLMSSTLADDGRGHWHGLLRALSARDQGLLQFALAIDSAGLADMASNLDGNASISVAGIQVVCEVVRAVRTIWNIDEEGRVVHLADESYLQSCKERLERALPAEPAAAAGLPGSPGPRVGATWQDKLREACESFRVARKLYQDARDALQSAASRAAAICVNGTWVLSMSSKGVCTAAVEYTPREGHAQEYVGAVDLHDDVARFRLSAPQRAGGEELDTPGVNERMPWLSQFTSTVEHVMELCKVYTELARLGCSFIQLGDLHQFTADTALEQLQEWDAELRDLPQLAAARLRGLMELHPALGFISPAVIWKLRAAVDGGEPDTVRELLAQHMPWQAAQAQAMLEPADIPGFMADMQQATEEADHLAAACACWEALGLHFDACFQQYSVPSMKEFGRSRFVRQVPGRRNLRPHRSVLRGHGAVYVALEREQITDAVCCVLARNGQLPTASSMLFCSCETDSHSIRSALARAHHLGKTGAVFTVVGAEQLQAEPRQLLLRQLQEWKYLSHQGQECPARVALVLPHSADDLLYRLRHIVATDPQLIVPLTDQGYRQFMSACSTGLPWVQRTTLVRSSTAGAGKTTRILQEHRALPEVPESAMIPKCILGSQHDKQEVLADLLRAASSAEALHIELYSFLEADGSIQEDTLVLEALLLGTIYDFQRQTWIDAAPGQGSQRRVYWELANSAGQSPERVRAGSAQFIQHFPRAIEVNASLADLRMGCEPRLYEDARVAAAGMLFSRLVSPAEAMQAHQGTAIGEAHIVEAAEFFGGTEPSGWFMLGELGTPFTARIMDTILPEPEVVSAVLRAFLLKHPSLLLDGSLSSYHPVCTLTRLIAYFVRMCSATLLNMLAQQAGDRHLAPSLLKSIILQNLHHVATNGASVMQQAATEEGMPAHQVEQMQADLAAHALDMTARNSIVMVFKSADDICPAVIAHSPEDRGGRRDRLHSAAVPETFANTLGTLSSVVQEAYAAEAQISRTEFNRAESDSRAELCSARYGSLEALLQRRAGAQDNLMEELFGHAAELGNYVLCADNLLKMAMVHMYLQAGLGVLLLGEAGVGKTQLQQVLASFANWVFTKDHRKCLNASTTLGELTEFMERAIRTASTHPDEVHVVHIDEVNTSSALLHCKDIVVDRTFRGQQLPRNLRVVCCVNPYRRRAVNPENVAGLPGELHQQRASELMYRVHPLPCAMFSNMMNFGKLQPDDLADYMRSILRQHLRLNDPERVLQAVHAAHLHIDARDHTVSLRDVMRFVRVWQWLAGLRVPLLAGGTRAPISARARLNQTEVLLVALYLVYEIKLASRQQRTQFRAEVGSIALPRTEWLRRAQPSAAVLSQWRDAVLRCEELVLSEVQPARHVARHAVLRENLFVIYACILLREPLMMVGRPGASKSLALALVIKHLSSATAASGNGQNVTVHPCVYQGSLQSTSQSVIQGVQNTQQRQDLARAAGRRDLYLHVLDELGLAAKSPFNPLKALHPLFEQEVDPTGLDIMSDPRIAIVCVSNTQVDAAQANRAIVLSCMPLDAQDLLLTARHVVQQYVGTPAQQTVDHGMHLLGPVLQRYCADLPHQQPIHFHGARDVYGMCGSLGRILCALDDRQRGLGHHDAVAAQVAEAVYSNFNEWNRVAACVAYAVHQHFSGDDFERVGPDHVRFRDKLLRAIPEAAGGRIIDPVLQLAPSSPTHLLQLGLSDQMGRNLLLATDAVPFAISFVQQQVRSIGKVPYVLVGHQFSKEDPHSFATRQLRQVVHVMAQPNAVLIMVGLEATYEALYNLFNGTLSGVSPNGGSFCRVALGNFGTERCEVSAGFKAVLIAPPGRARQYDRALLNRVTKLYITQADLMRGHSELPQQVLQRVREEYLALQEHMLLHDGWHLTHALESLILSEQYEHPEEGVEQLAARVRQAVYQATGVYGLLSAGRRDVLKQQLDHGQRFLCFQDALDRLNGQAQVVRADVTTFSAGQAQEAAFDLTQFHHYTWMHASELESELEFTTRCNEHQFEVKRCGRAPSTLYAVVLDMGLDSLDLCVFVKERVNRLAQDMQSIPGRHCVLLVMCAPTTRAGRTATQFQELLFSASGAATRRIMVDDMHNYADWRSCDGVFDSGALLTAKSVLLSGQPDSRVLPSIIRGILLRNLMKITAQIDLPETLRGQQFQRLPDAIGRLLACDAFAAKLAAEVASATHDNGENVLDAPLNLEQVIQEAGGATWREGIVRHVEDRVVDVAGRAMNALSPLESVVQMAEHHSIDDVEALSADWAKLEPLVWNCRRTQQLRDFVAAHQTQTAGLSIVYCTVHARLAMAAPSPGSHAGLSRLQDDELGYLRAVAVDSTATSEHLLEAMGTLQLSQPCAFASDLVALAGCDEELGLPVMLYFCAAGLPPGSRSMGVAHLLGVMLCISIQYKSEMVGIAGQLRQFAAAAALSADQLTGHLQALIREAHEGSPGSILRVQLEVMLQQVQAGDDLAALRRPLQLLEQFLLRSLREMPDLWHTVMPALGSMLVCLRLTRAAAEPAGGSVLQAIRASAGQLQAAISAARAAAGEETHEQQDCSGDDSSDDGDGDGGGGVHSESCGGAAAGDPGASSEDPALAPAESIRDLVTAAWIRPAQEVMHAMLPHSTSSGDSLALCAATILLQALSTVQDPAELGSGDLFTSSRLAVMSVMELAVRGIQRDSAGASWEDMLASLRNSRTVEVQAAQALMTRLLGIYGHSDSPLAATAADAVVMSWCRHFPPGSDQQQQQQRTSDAWQAWLPAGLRAWRGCTHELERVCLAAGIIRAIAESCAALPKQEHPEQRVAAAVALLDRCASVAEVDHGLRCPVWFRTMFYELNQRCNLLDALSRSVVLQSGLGAALNRELLREVRADCQLACNPLLVEGPPDTLTELAVSDAAAALRAGSGTWHTMQGWTAVQSLAREASPDSHARAAHYLGQYFIFSASSHQQLREILQAVAAQLREEWPAISDVLAATRESAALALCMWELAERILCLLVHEYAVESPGGVLAPVAQLWQTPAALSELYWPGFATSHLTQWSVLVAHENKLRRGSPTTHYNECSTCGFRIGRYACSDIQSQIFQCACGANLQRSARSIAVAIPATLDATPEAGLYPLWPMFELGGGDVQGRWPGDVHPPDVSIACRGHSARDTAKLYFLGATLLNIGVGFRAPACFGDAALQGLRAMRLARPAPGQRGAPNAPVTGHGALQCFRRCAMNLMKEALGGKLQPIQLCQWTCQQLRALIAARNTGTHTLHSNEGRTAWEQAVLGLGADDELAQAAAKLRVSCAVQQADDRDVAARQELESYLTFATCARLEQVQSMSAQDRAVQCPLLSRPRPTPKTSHKIRSFNAANAVLLQLCLAERPPAELLAGRALVAILRLCRAVQRLAPGMTRAAAWGTSIEEWLSAHPGQRAEFELALPQWNMAVDYLHALDGCGAIRLPKLSAAGPLAMLAPAADSEGDRPAECTRLEGRAPDNAPYCTKMLLYQLARKHNELIAAMQHYMRSPAGAHLRTVWPTGLREVDAAAGGPTYFSCSLAELSESDVPTLATDEAAAAAAAAEEGGEGSDATGRGADADLASGAAAGAAAAPARSAKDTLREMQSSAWMGSQALQDIQDRHCFACLDPARPHLAVQTTSAEYELATRWLQSVRAVHLRGTANAPHDGDVPVYAWAQAAAAANHMDERLLNHRELTTPQADTLEEEFKLRGSLVHELLQAIGAVLEFVRAVGCTEQQCEMQLRELVRVVGSEGGRVVPRLQALHTSAASSATLSQLVALERFCFDSAVVYSPDLVRQDATAAHSQPLAEEQEAALETWLALMLSTGQAQAVRGAMVIIMRGVRVEWQGQTPAITTARHLHDEVARNDPEALAQALPQQLREHTMNWIAASAHEEPEQRIPDCLCLVHAVAALLSMSRLWFDQVMAAATPGDDVTGQHDLAGYDHLLDDFGGSFGNDEDSDDSDVEW